MKKLFNVILCLFFINGCSSHKLSEEKKINDIYKILSINEYNFAYHIKALKQNCDRYINIISYKKAYYDKYNIEKPFIDSTIDLKPILKNSYRNFCLNKMRYNVSSMEQLGNFIIIENDTIWSGRTANEQEFYSSCNSIDLIVKE